MTHRRRATGSLRQLPRTMLRRLVRRFSEEGGGLREGPTGVNGGAGGGGGGGISQKGVGEIDLDVGSEEVRPTHSSHALTPSRARP